MYENGTNIGNTPDCPECEQYERENERLREEVLRLELEIKARIPIEWMEHEIRWGGDNGWRGRESSGVHRIIREWKDRAHNKEVSSE